MTARPTRLEAGSNHVLAYCVHCPPFRRLAGDRPEALRLAADHVEYCHGQTYLAAQLRAQASRTEARHAQKHPPAGQ